jgi:hypothetical protein
MLRKLRSRITYANVVATMALFVAVGTGGAYAANTVFSTDIVDGEVKSVDIGDAEIKSADVKDQSLTTFDVSTFLGADVVDGTLTGADVADTSSLGPPDIFEESLMFNNTLVADDIATGAVGTDEVADNSLGNGDFLTGSVDSRVATDNSLASADVQNGSLNDEDISQTFAVDFAGTIGVVPATTCVYKGVDGLSALGDHLLLTPSYLDAAVGLVYSPRYDITNDRLQIHICNFTGAIIDDATTHFNLLVFDAQ